MTIAVGSGLAAQIVVKDETTWGVAASLTSGVDSFEFLSETLELKKTVVQGQGLAAGHVYERTKRRVPTEYDVQGDISLEMPTRNLGFWLRHMVGDFTEIPAELGTSGIYQTVFQPKSGLLGHSFTIQKGVPTVDNATVEPFTYVGCKIPSWELSVKTGGLADLSLKIDGRNELAGAGNGDPLNGSIPTLATWAPVTTGLGMGLWNFKEAILYSGGTPTLVAGTGSIAGAPAVPTSTTPVTNTTGQTAMVTIVGGTMTNVSVNGVSVGTGPGTYAVPSGQSITLTYTAAPTWTWYVAVVTLAGETPLGNVTDISVQHALKLDATRQFIGGNGFKDEQIEDGYRKISGAFTVEWLSTEATYNDFSADTTTSLELKFTGPSVDGDPYLLDIIIPNIKLEGDSPKVSGPAVITQKVSYTGLDDETTVPIQVTYQSEDSTF